MHWFEPTNEPGPFVIDPTQTVPAGAGTKPAPEPSAELRGVLNDLEGHRHSSEANFVEMERRLPALIARFTDRDDRSRIYYQFAHVYGQTDITRYAERVLDEINIV